MLTLLHFLPESFYWLIVWLFIVGGLVVMTAGYVISVVPKFLTKLSYSTPLKIIGTILLVIGVYLHGAYSTEVLWREKAEELKKKLKTAEEKSKEVKTIVETRVETKVKYIEKKVKGDVIYIREKAEYLDSQCDLPDIVFGLHDRAASEEIPGSTTDPSGKTN
jgi:Ethanolamine utilization protein EutJ (predicted chaperonin)